MAGRGTATMFVSNIIINGAPAQHRSIASLRAVNQFSGSCLIGALTAPMLVPATTDLPFPIRVDNYLSIDRSRTESQPAPRRKSTIHRLLDDRVRSREK